MMVSSPSSVPAAAAAGDVAILVVSCDAYRDLWRPFFRCFAKYWPDCPYPLHLGSNHATYADPRVTPVPIGPDRDYSSNLRAMLERVRTPWVILWVEDLMLSAPVDGQRLVRLITEAQSKGAASLKLMAHFPYAYPENGTDEIGVIPSGSRYRVNIGITLFRRDVLLALLEPGRTAWDIEYGGGSDLSNVPGEFYALSSHVRANPPLSFVNTVGRGKWMRNALPFLKREGFGDILAGRPVQPWRPYLYYRAYLIRLEIYRRLKVRW